MMITRILFIILLGINVAVAQNFWHRYHQQEYPNYFEDPELHDVLHFNPSRLRSYEMVGIPSVAPTLRHYAINDSFEAGIPPFKPPTHYGARETPINILDYLLYRQHVFPRNPFEIYRERALRKQEMVVRHAQTQSVIMAEECLSNSGSNKDQTCTQRSFCDIAINEEDIKSETSIAAAEAIRMMEKMMDVAGAKTSRYATRQKYPHISQLIASYTVGKLTKDQYLCKSLFPCNDGTSQDVEGRQFSCKQIGAICPGVSLTCGLCAVLSPESCGAVCPVAAIFCGTSGFACKIKSKDEANEPDVATEEASGVDGSGAAEPAEDSDQETEEEGSGELAEKRSGIQEDVDSDIRQDSEPHQGTVENELNKASLSESIISKQDLEKDDIKVMENLNTPENVKIPDFKWKSEIHSRNE